MLDTQFIRENRQQVEADAKAKGVAVDLARLLELDTERRQLIAKLDELRAERNRLAQATKGQKPGPDSIQKGKQLKLAAGELEAKLGELEPQLRQLELEVPNILHESVKRGPGETANEVVKTVGQKPEFDFDPADHETLGLALDIIDLESAAHASGSRFYYLKGAAVTLEFALVNWLLQKYVAKGFTPVTTPVLVREHMLESTGFFPADKNEIYHVNPNEDNLYLIGTSEVTLAGLHMLKPLESDQLPKRYVGFSSCFRREAGSYGQDTKGIFRVHQFDKVEMYSYCHPDRSWDEHEYLFGIEEEILQELGFHYQVINIGSGDLGAPAAKKYDCEVWLPAQGRYRELTSCSNTTDFQARRGGMKFRDDKGKLELVHTLNGTAMASTRTIIAILENFQTKDGRVVIPEVLRPYLNGQDII
ncbi:MAG TPA: serine--tRNA ligase [Candidatus Saccharimonadales bacterium]